MNSLQEKRFYANDTKCYDLKENKEFLKWLYNEITSGYHCYIGPRELQELIDYIVNWYEIKYPEKEFDYYDGTRYINFQDVRSISNVMNIKQLLYRLSRRQYNLIKCGYRAKGFSQNQIHINGKCIGLEPRIFMTLDKNNDNQLHGQMPYLFLRANQLSGKVIYDNQLRKYINNNNITLDNLLILLKEKYSNEFNFNELEECVNNHKCDIELRNKILQLVALKLLYSKNTSPLRGYERAKRFINEFNKKLGLNLSTKEIDNVINEDYSCNEIDLNTCDCEQNNKFKKLIKNIFDKKTNKLY